LKTLLCACTLLTRATRALVSTEPSCASAQFTEGATAAAAEPGHQPMQPLLDQVLHFRVRMASTGIYAFLELALVLRQLRDVCVQFIDRKSREFKVRHVRFLLT